MMRGGCHGAARTDLFELRRVAHYKPDKNPVRTTEKPPGERFALNITSLLLRGRYYCSDMGGGGRGDKRWRQRAGNKRERLPSN